MDGTASMQVVPALLAEIARLRAENDRLTREAAEARALIDEWSQPVPQSEWQKKCAENERLRDGLEWFFLLIENEEGYELPEWLIGLRETQEDAIAAKGE